MNRSWQTVVVTGALVIAVIGVIELSQGRTLPLGLERVVFVEPDPEPAWAQRIALVDEALGREDLSRAIYEWREAYAAALGTRRWDPLAEVGDRAVRISRLSGGSSVFLAEARDVYLHALSRARTERSVEGAERIAEAFERLGDFERARQARRIAALVS